MVIFYTLHFFINTRAKEEKTPTLKGSKKKATERIFAHPPEIII